MTMLMKRRLEGKFNNILSYVNMDGAFGYSILEDKIKKALADDKFVELLLDKYGQKLFSVRAQYSKRMSRIYNDYMSTGTISDEDMEFLKKTFEIYIKQIIVSMVAENDLFILGNPSKPFERNNIEYFAFTFDPNLETNEISKGEVIDVMRERLKHDIDDQCLAVLLLLDNQTESEIENVKTKFKNKVGFSNRTERLTLIGLKLRSDDPVLTPKELEDLSTIYIHAEQLFNNYKEFFSVIRTGVDTYYFDGDVFTTED